MAILSRFLGGVIASVTGIGGTAVVADLGFIPSYAEGLDASSGDVFWKWNAGMENVTGGANIFGFIASNSAGGQFGTISAGTGGITSLDGSAGTVIGLTIGTNTIINVASHAILITAWRAQ